MSAPVSPELQKYIIALGAEQTGENQWQARCPNPAHTDEHASFALTGGRKKPVAVECHGGCDWADIKAALSQLGLDVGQVIKRAGTRTNRKAPVRRTPPAPVAPPPPLDDQEKPYDWHQLLMGRHTKPREFLQNQRGLTEATIERFKLGFNGERITIPIRVEGHWVNAKLYKSGAQGPNKMLQIPGHGTAVLYPLEVLADSTAPVILCEGELDALLTLQKGDGRFLALTGTGGAANPPRDLSALAGREVFVAYDADKAGVSGAKKVQERLVAVGATARILDLTRLGLTYIEKEGEDLTDYWMNHDGTVEALLAEMDRLRSNAPERFKTVTAADLAQPVPPMEWMVKGVWPAGSYGVLAGEKKTLKTYTAISLMLAVASGQPFLGRFEVVTPRPVLMYLGEGGKGPTQRRIQRIAEHMGVDLASLPLRMVFDAGDVTGDEFVAAFRRAVDDEQPGLVIIDPLYAYHPAGVEAQNLYDRGAMLAQISQSMPPGCALVIADHFRKTSVGQALDLDSIAQSGVGQWADSWVLMQHDTPPRVDEGDFSIGVQFGSRQWGGQQYVVDWAFGRFDADTGEHDGDLSVEVRNATWGAKKSGGGEGRQSALGAAILTLVEDSPLQYTKTQVRDEVRGSQKVGVDSFAKAWNELISAGRLTSEKAPGEEGAMRERWRLSDATPPRLVLPETDPESG
ncbi:Toprim domain-containing protein [Rathayibacter oskolensis]|uniref:Toprim domain-containing protein n=1 Tax=Rathayibacter oskolensis TaxID=1891671 RepID=A0A1X7N093_9MICO|nr:AAA family ATPase [Rathayibacter oskolensis]SMH30664.1 Toprim domain-containing protein [Rathayibacter oskolensis]